MNVAMFLCTLGVCVTIDALVTFRHPHHRWPGICGAGQLDLVVFGIVWGINGLLVGIGCLRWAPLEVWHAYL